MEMRTTTPAPSAADVGKAQVASFLEIDAAALRHNLQVFREAIGDGGDAPRVGVVLKGNAYGHGLASVLPAVHAFCDCLYVIAPGEAEGIRAWEAQGELPRRRVLVIGAVSATEAVRLSELDVEVVIGDKGFTAWAEALRVARGKPLVVHVHVDTGLGREGFLPSELPSLLRQIASCRDVLDIRGCLSHFANVEDVTEQAYALEQVSRFQDAVTILESGGVEGVE
ncbi:MAG: alanine racemase, partial [Myxococcota bacterium]